MDVSPPKTENSPINIRSLLGEMLYLLSWVRKTESMLVPPEMQLVRLPVDVSVSVPADIPRASCVSVSTGKMCQYLPHIPHTFVSTCHTLDVSMSVPTTRPTHYMCQYLPHVPHTTCVSTYHTSHTLHVSVPTTRPTHYMCQYLPHVPHTTCVSTYHTSHTLHVSVPTTRPTHYMCYYLPHVPHGCLLNAQQLQGRC